MNSATATQFNFQELSRLHQTNCVCTATRRAARAVTQLYDLVLSPVGLKASQLVILKAIADHGEIAQFEIAKEYAIAVETLSRRLSKMRSAGWVQVRVGSGKRERIYSLTPKGVDLVQQALPHWSRAQSRLAIALNAQSDPLAIVRTLDQLTNAAYAALNIRASNSVDC